MLENFQNSRIVGQQVFEFWWVQKQLVSPEFPHLGFPHLGLPQLGLPQLGPPQEERMKAYRALHRVQKDYADFGFLVVFLIRSPGYIFLVFRQFDPCPKLPRNQLQTGRCGFQAFCQHRRSKENERRTTRHPGAGPQGGVSVLFGYWNCYLPVLFLFLQCDYVFSRC